MPHQALEGNSTDHRTGERSQFADALIESVSHINVVFGIDGHVRGSIEAGVGSHAIGMKFARSTTAPRNSSDNCIRTTSAQMSISYPKDTIQQPSRPQANDKTSPATKMPISSHTILNARLKSTYWQTTHRYTRRHPTHTDGTHSHLPTA
jgi:hypothetical protein